MADTPAATYNDQTSYSPTPGSGSYGVLQAQAEGAYSSALSQINSQRTSFLQNQGLTGTYDAQTGNFTGFNVSADNQGGAYQQMENANAGQAAADHAAISAMGFGGGLQRQQEEAAQKGYSQNATNWALNAGAGLGSLTQQGLAAGQTASDSLYNGLVSDIGTAIQNGTFNPANYSNVDLVDYGKLTGDDITALATGLGFKGGTSTTGGVTGVGPGTGGTGTHPAGYGTGHSHYDTYVNGGGTMTLTQWLASGRAGHRG